MLKIAYVVISFRDVIGTYRLEQRTRKRTRNKIKSKNSNGRWVNGKPINYVSEQTKFQQKATGTNSTALVFLIFYIQQFLCLIRYSPSVSISQIVKQQVSVLREAATVYWASLFQITAVVEWTCPFLPSLALSFVWKPLYVSGLLLEPCSSACRLPHSRLYRLVGSANLPIRSMRRYSCRSFCSSPCFLSLLPLDRRSS